MSVTGEAGRRGDDIRSDCYVYFIHKSSGGHAIDLESKVASLYGDSIRRDASEILASLGIEHAELLIRDTGASPFILGARIEAAAKRAFPDLDQDWLPAMLPQNEVGTKRDRFRRSRLYLPGNEPKFLPNAGLHKPDAVILDLEDSVAHAEKDAARFVVRNALRQVDFYGAERMVRINPGALGLRDLEAIIPQNVHVILIPKCESADSVREIAAKIEAVSAAGAASNKVYLMPIVETALGIERAFAIASAHPSVVALTIGLEDYTADIGAPRSEEGRESRYARSAVVNAARAAGVSPIDSVFSDVANEEKLRANVLESKALGFDGMGCIHPRQIGVIHAGFAPTDAEVERARQIVAAFEEAERNGSGVVSLGSKMIDPPVVKRALRVVRLADGMSASGAGTGGGA